MRAADPGNTCLEELDRGGDAARRGRFLGGSVLCCALATWRLEGASSRERGSTSVAAAVERIESIGDEQGVTIFTFRNANCADTFALDSRTLAETFLVMNLYAASRACCRRAARRAVQSNWTLILFTVLESDVLQPVICPDASTEICSLIPPTSISKEKLARSRSW